MTEPAPAAAVPFVTSVLHPTDFSEASRQAFAHALAIALVRQTSLTLLHVGREHLAEDEWTRFPLVRPTLERWGLLAPGEDDSAQLRDLSLRVKKVSIQGGDPVRGILEYQEQQPSDLIVLATEQREGLPRWLRGSVSESVARRAQVRTLFVPDRARGFVGLGDGSTTLRRVLVPVDLRPDPSESLVLACRAAEMLGERPVEIETLHVGEGQGPAPSLPESGDGAWRWSARREGGDAVERIVARAQELPADLLVMTTEGGGGLLEVMRGSVTQQVLRRAPCPLLAAPSIGL